jgi:putative flippase GtrA
MTRQQLVRLVRFVAFNGVGTLLDVSVVYALRHLAGAPWGLAVVSGWASSVLIGFVVNRRFVFRDGLASFRHASTRYLVLVAFNLAVGVGLVTVLVSHGWNYVLTRLLSSSFLVLFNFVVSHTWVFSVPLPVPEEERA